MNGASANVAAGTKRKREQGPKFYAVHAGIRPGVYHSWNDCLAQVKGFKGALFKSFTTLSEAEGFVKDPTTYHPPSGAAKFYAVRGGRQPGVYTDWAIVQDLIQGWKGIKHKSFATRAEAEAFVKGEAQSQIDGADEGKKKKARKSALDHVPGTIVDETIEPGTGPMPSVAQDGFDPNIKLNPETGKLEYKSAAERGRSKMQAKGLAEGSVLKIYTDGSSLGNGAKGATAGVGVYFGPRDPRYVSRFLLSFISNRYYRNLSEALKGVRQTNQRAELTAVLRALQLAPLDRDVLIYSDSNYSIKCVTEWFLNWRRNGWLNASGKPVENKDIIETILTKIEERQVVGSKTLFEWLKGHANDPGNEAADSLAVSGAREARFNRVDGDD